MDAPRETMNVVIVGHVDHGKSTLVGRLLADTGVLGDGKLEKVQETCKLQGKIFEYAFLLDALEEEQGQGITIDAARVFFRSDLRDYIIIDAPGHIEFLKNMVTGAARAEAAVLLIDANEGVRENSRRHGYLLSMLGIRQVVVAVNKIDLVDYSQDVFRKIVEEYSEFLASIGIVPQCFIPVSAREGDMVVNRGDRLSWYEGPPIVAAVDEFRKQAAPPDQPLRMVVQDVYKFNQRGDDRRIIAGRVEAGTLRVGDEVIFSPSGKSAKVETIEAFSAPNEDHAVAGFSTAFTLDEQIYVSRGEVVSHLTKQPSVSTKFRANLFWLGKAPMAPGKRYKLKLGTAQTDVTIDEIHRILDASDLDATGDKDEVERHDVADLVLRARNPVAFDRSLDIESTGRFVIVDGYDIAGGGIVREAVHDEYEEDRQELLQRESNWKSGDATPMMRAELNQHAASMVFFTGKRHTGKRFLARALELALHESLHRTYFLDGRNVEHDDELDEAIKSFGDAAHLLLETGLIVISTSNVIGHIMARVSPYPMFVVHMGPEAEGLPEGADLRFDPIDSSGDAAPLVEAIVAELHIRSRLLND
jgi:bifunctional enzyme CysN/CysC